MDPQFGTYTGFYQDEELPIQRGQRVRIPKGTYIYTTHPSRDNGPSKRSQTVTVHHLMSGQGKGNNPRFVTDPIFAIDLIRPVDVKNPRVVWVGSGSYWFEADINDVEVV